MGITLTQILQTSSPQGPQGVQGVSGYIGADGAPPSTGDIKYWNGSAWTITPY